MKVNAECNLGRLQNCFRNMEDTMLGLKTPVSTFLCDEKGQITEKNILKFTNMVIFHQCWLNGKYVGISGAYKRYFELLFYLIFRAFDLDEWIVDMGELVRVTEDLRKDCKSREELILRDGGLIGNPVGFWHVIRESCKLLNGRSLAGDYTEIELNQMKREYLLKMNAYEKMTFERKALFELNAKAKEEIWEKYEDYGIEGYDDFWDALESRNLGYEYPLEVEEEMENELSNNWSIRKRRYLTVEESRRKALRRQAWIDSFGNPEEYLNAYREFCELHFCVNIVTDVPRFRDSVLSILEKEGFNKLEEDEKMQGLYRELTRAARNAKRRY